MKILGIFRGFPGLGRVVAGVSLLEEMRDSFDHEVKFISYLQGKKYLETKGYQGLPEVTNADYSSIGLLPTNKFSVYIFETIKVFTTDLILIDGEPLILHSIKISFPHIKIATLLNPSDVENPSNDKEAMEYFNSLYSMADLAIVHGLKKSVKTPSCYKNIITIPTILRKEVLDLKHRVKSNNIYCVLGGGTLNSGDEFIESTVRMGKMVKQLAAITPEYAYHILCASKNIYDSLNSEEIQTNVTMHERILPPQDYYLNAGAIITRSGRNTLSELAYLGIPAITFITGDKYRVEEQRNNAESLGDYNIVSMNINSTVDKIAKCIKHTLCEVTAPAAYLTPGNQQALREIRQILNIDNEIL